MESQRCDPPSRDAPDGTGREGRARMATKDKNAEKSMEMKPAQKTLQARKAKK